MGLDTAEHATSNVKRPDFVSIIDGTTLELWGLKTLAGLYSANFLAADGRPLLETRVLDQVAVRDSLFGHGPRKNCGLYVSHETGFRDDGNISIAALSSDTNVAGLTIQLSALKLNFFLSSDGGSSAYFTNGNSFFRPNLIAFQGKKNYAALICKWHEIARKNPVAVTIGLELFSNKQT